MNNLYLKFYTNHMAEGHLSRPYFIVPKNSFSILKSKIEAAAGRYSLFPSFQVNLTPEPKQSQSFQTIKMNQESSLAQTAF